MKLKEQEKLCNKLKAQIINISNEKKAKPGVEKEFKRSYELPKGPNDIFTVTRYFKDSPDDESSEESSSNEHESARDESEQRKIDEMNANKSVKKKQDYPRHNPQIHTHDSR